jgi:restriction system protein
MAIPTYEDFMLPLLSALDDGQVHQLRDLYVPLARLLGLTDEEIAKKLPSGQQRVVNNRIGWARTYLLHAGLLASPKRGSVAITDRGRSVLRENRPEIDRRFLERFDSFREFWQRSVRRQRPESLEGAGDVDSSATPEETIEAVHEQLREQLAADLLQKLKDSSSYFFEKVVLRLLEAMGYGGVSGSGLVTPASRDGGIDGVIHEDKLGLDTVCIQAKKWENTVGRPKVQEFVGSMDLHRSKKGVVLTTSQFSGDALDYVNRIEGKKVVLIDGDKLCELMIEHRVGVTPKRNYELLDISEDFFAEDE